MSWVGSRGILRTASGSPSADSPEVDGEFLFTYDAGLLDRKVPHTIKFWIKVNPGVDNDLVRIYIDGR